MPPDAALVSPFPSAPTIGHLRSVHIGKIAPLGADSIPSGFVKHPVSGAVPVGLLGLGGDEQADMSVHGGPEKAVYGYSLANYAHWRAAYSRHAEKFIAGGLGENLAIDGPDETDTCIGDSVAIGSAVLQVCQFRQPCFKFALRFDDSEMPRAMMQNGLCGWYYRVLQPGSLQAGDAVKRLDRPNPGWTIARFFTLFAAKNFARTDLIELAELRGLSSNWQAKARSRLTS